MIMVYIDRSLSIRADEADKYLSIYLTAATIVTDPSTGNSDGIYTRKVYQAVPCGQLLDRDPSIKMSDYLNGKNLGFLESMFRDYMLCFDFGNDTTVTAEGRGSDIVYRYVNLNVGPCSLGSLCKDPDIVLN